MYLCLYGKYPIAITSLHLNSEFKNEKETPSHVSE